MLAVRERALEALQAMMSLLLVAALLGGWELLRRPRRRRRASSSPRPARSPPRCGTTASLLWSNLLVTAQEVGLGILLALVLGFLLAVALHFSGTLRRGVYPLLVASQAVPIVIIAPLLVVWFGFGIAPKLAIIALVCFFPVVVTTLDALRSVDPDQLKLMRTLDASRWQAFRWAEAPAALPAALSGAKIAVAVAVIGAVFAEYAGSSEGLGHLMLQSIPPARDAARLRRRRPARRLRHPALRRPRPRRAPPRPLGPSPTGRTRPLTRRLPLVLLVLAAVLLAACGERKEPTAAPAQQRPAAHARLLPQRRPRGDLRRQGQRRLQPRRARRADPDAQRPRRAAQAAGRRQGRPRHLLRARAAARARQGPASSSRSARWCRSR